MSERREIQSRWLVSPDVPNRIDEVGQHNVSLLSIAMACNSGTLGEAVANNIADCHNGCLGIPEPETTVPEVVDVCCRLHDALDEAIQYKGKVLREKHGDDKLLIEARAVLDKTGKNRD